MADLDPVLSGGGLEVNPRLFEVVYPEIPNSPSWAHVEALSHLMEGEEIPPDVVEALETYSIRGRTELTTSLLGWNSMGPDVRLASAAEGRFEEWILIHILRSYGVDDTPRSIAEREDLLRVAYAVGKSGMR